MCLVFHHTPFWPCLSLVRCNVRQYRWYQQRQLSHRQQLQCFGLVSAAHGSDAAPEASQASNSSCLRNQAALKAISLQRASQRSSQVVVAWLRSADGKRHSKPTLLENASQPSTAIGIQIFLVWTFFGKQGTVWESVDRVFANARTFCLASPSTQSVYPVRLPSLSTQSVHPERIIDLAPLQPALSVCRRDPAPLVGCAQL